jgi:hypothetical protein
MDGTVIARDDPSGWFHLDGDARSGRRAGERVPMNEDFWTQAANLSRASRELRERSRQLRDRADRLVEASLAVRGTPPDLSGKTEGPLSHPHFIATWMVAFRTMRNSSSGG